ncbi:hypothetical protein BU204_35220 [Actinophytocola xanthii]|uniref:PE domain-containing protein n=2 Tax=Actinophytocola xanthii TaxID=1912961 RepID=A0A1Q8C0P6_9PSEU|nr:hypothetical protein BU204_35220 [Actinophytocola xanthii]
MFARAASEGSFAVNETGGQALLAAIREMRDWIDGKMGDFGLLQQEPALGSSDGAQTIKPYVVNVAVDQQGFITMLTEFRASLDEAEQGINAAMASYQEMDTGIGGRFPAQA